MKVVWLLGKGVESHQDVITQFQAGVLYVCTGFPKHDCVSSDPLSCSKYAEYAWIMIEAQVIA